MWKNILLVVGLLVLCSQEGMASEIRDDSEGRSAGRPPAAVLSLLRDLDSDLDAVHRGPQLTDADGIFRSVNAQMDRDFAAFRARGGLVRREFSREEAIRREITQALSDIRDLPGYSEIIRAVSRGARMGAAEIRALGALEHGEILAGILRSMVQGADMDAKTIEIISNISCDRLRSKILNMLIEGGNFSYRDLMEMGWRASPSADDDEMYASESEED